MKPALRLKHPDHPSYLRHRQQLWVQILLPMLLGTAVFVVAPAAVWAIRMGGGGNVGRWAAISTIWLLLPAMVAGAILLAILLVLIFMTGRIQEWIPRYSYSLQHFFARAAAGTRRGAEMVRKPVLAIRGLGSLAKNSLKRLRERV